MVSSGHALILLDQPEKSWHGQTTCLLLLCLNVTDRKKSFINLNLTVDTNADTFKAHLSDVHPGVMAAKPFYFITYASYKYASVCCRKIGAPPTPK
jgi:hypothetical protein